MSKQNVMKKEEKSHNALFFSFVLSPLCSVNVSSSNGEGGCTAPAVNEGEEAEEEGVDFARFLTETDCRCRRPRGVKRRQHTTTAGGKRKMLVS